MGEGGVGGPLGAGNPHTIILHTPLLGFQFLHRRFRFIILLFQLLLTVPVGLSVVKVFTRCYLAIE